jgi:NDP-sugar pyrophosphorylase family protein
MTEPKYLKTTEELSKVLTTGGGVSYLKSDSFGGNVTLGTRNGGVYSLNPRTFDDLYHSARNDEETLAGRTGIESIIPLIGIESPKREKRPYYIV